MKKNSAGQDERESLVLITNAQHYSESQAILEQVRRRTARAEAHRLEGICPKANRYDKLEACLLDISHGQGRSETLS